MSKLLIDFAKQYYKNIMNMPTQYQKRIRDNLNNKPFDSVLNDFDAFSVIYANSIEDNIIVRASGQSGVFNFLINPKEYSKKRVLKLINRYHEDFLNLKKYKTQINITVKKGSENLKILVKRKKKSEHMMNTRRSEVLFYCRFWVYFEDTEPLFVDRNVKHIREFLFEEEFTDEEISLILGIPLNTVIGKRNKFNRNKETVCH